MTKCQIEYYVFIFFISDVKYLSIVVISKLYKIQISANMTEFNNNITQESFKSFLQGIRSGSIQETQKMLRVYGEAIANKLQPQSHQPALYFAAIAQSDDISSQLFKLLIRHGANYKFKDRNEQTILFYVCRQGKQKCAQILLSQGLSLDDVDVYGQTAIFYAASENRIQIIRKYATKQRVNHADNLAGETPLYYAARRGHLEICKILLEKGADITHVDKNGKTAIQLARKAKFAEVTDLFNMELRRLKEDGNKISMQSYSLQESTQRKKRQDNIKNQRQTYKIVFLNEKGEPHDLTEEDVRKLIKQKPQLQAYLINPEEIPQELVQTSNAENWSKVAGKILTQCSKSKGAYWFTQPVDPIKYNIIDYFDVISQPMDLSTVRKKLAHNCYMNPDEFEADISLIWKNCYKYNGENHDISRCAKQLEASFIEYVAAYGLDKFKENK